MDTIVRKSCTLGKTEASPDGLDPRKGTSAVHAHFVSPS